METNDEIRTKRHIIWPASDRDDEDSVRIFSFS